MIWESVQTKNWKNYENEKQFAWNAENLAIFNENNIRIWKYEDAWMRWQEDWKI